MRYTQGFPHSIGQEEAIRRLREKFATILANYQDRVDDFNGNWTGHLFLFAFEVEGMSFAGTVTAEPAWITLEVEMPLAVMFAKQKIEDYLLQGAEELLAPR